MSNQNKQTISLPQTRQGMANLPASMLAELYDRAGLAQPDGTGVPPLLTDELSDEWLEAETYGDPILRTLIADREESAAAAFIALDLSDEERARWSSRYNKIGQMILRQLRSIGHDDGVEFGVETEEDTLSDD